MAAIEAAKFGVRVTLVDKGLMGRSGSSPTADMAMSAAFGHTSLEGDLGKDSIEQHYEDTMRRGEWLNRAPFGYANNPAKRNIEPHPVNHHRNRPQHDIDRVADE